MKLTRHSLFIIVLFFAALFNSCKNDLKLNAPYKEVPSIYAVINPQDRIKIIRINKVFLGEGDANKMAKVSDSINYQPGELTVSMQRFDDNGAKTAICPTCTDKYTVTFRDSVVQAAPGAFNTEQRVYVSNADLHISGKISGNYVLTVKNNHTGNVFTAKTIAVDSVSDNSGSQPFLGYYSTFDNGYSSLAAPSSNFIDYSEQNQTYSISYLPKTEAGTIYELIVRMWFYDKIGAGRVYHYIDYPQRLQYLKDAAYQAGDKALGVTFKGKDLFTVAANTLPQLNLSDNPRKMYKLEYFVYSSTDDYSDYLQFASPSLNIAQNKPLYSNFDNQAALGIFTFRARCSFYKEMSTSFISAFQNNTLTCQYRFLNNAETQQGCP